ncbi:MAG: carboxypeptidase-like regulatory domain-containing protein [Burkholderiales bacterium]
MKSTKSMIATAIAVSGLALTVNAFAASSSYLPATHRQGDVSYLSGGIGLNESDAIRHVAKAYPLELEFVLKAQPKAEYVANVKVRIKDTHDKTVLHATAAGPFLLAKLPAGKYTVSADRDGKVIQRQLEIAASGHQRVVFEWQS